VDSDRRLFFDSGIQYYAAARLLFFAGGAPVTGILAHLAIEMFLKGALCPTVSLDVLASRKFGHSLARLWERFKTEIGDAALAHFDATIDQLDPFEDLRYPDTVQVSSLYLSLVIDPAPLPATPADSRSCQLVLRDFDALVQRILAIASVDPVSLALHLGNEGRTALARDNATGIWTERETPG
jgi:hypothetical protein